MYIVEKMLGILGVKLDRIFLLALSVRRQLKKRLTAKTVLFLQVRVR